MSTASHTPNVFAQLRHSYEHNNGGRARCSSSWSSSGSTRQGGDAIHSILYADRLGWLISQERVRADQSTDCLLAVPSVRVPLFLLAGLAWRKTKRWNRERQERPIPYRVVKPPSEVITERARGEGKKKRRTIEEDDQQRARGIDGGQQKAPLY